MNCCGDPAVCNVTRANRCAVQQWTMFHLDLQQVQWDRLMAVILKTNAKTYKHIDNYHVRTRWQQQERRSGYEPRTRSLRCPAGNDIRCQPSLYSRTWTHDSDNKQHYIRQLSTLTSHQTLGLSLRSAVLVEFMSTLHKCVQSLVRNPWNERHIVISCPWIFRRHKHVWLYLKFVWVPSYWWASTRRTN